MTSNPPPADINHALTASELREVAKLAIWAKCKAYCPYSNFRVGACILVEPNPCLNSNVFTGANVEVASTPVGTCAERCALAPLVASIERPDLPKIRALAVSTDIWPPASPCGMCRQMIREFCEAETPIYMYGRDKAQGQVYGDSIMADKELEICGKPVVMTIGELLPMSFGPNDMEKREVKPTTFG